MKRFVSVFLALVLLLGVITPVQAASYNFGAEAKKTESYLLQKVPNPGFGTLVGEWTVLSLARNEANFPANYLENYYQKVESVVKEKQGVLHRAKYTEYSRVIVALNAIGKDPRNVGGHDLVAPLSSFSGVIKQGINGPIWALIALDTKNYEMPKNSNSQDQNSRERMVDEILRREVSGGGWNLVGDKADPDITAMALYALAPYQNSNEKVKTAVDRGVQALSDLQLSTGGYHTMGDENLESSAQVIIALTTLGINPQTDTRFVKYDGNGKAHSVVDAFMTYRNSDGSFRHIMNGTTDGMSTDQGMEALVALKRFQEGKAPLFQYKDVIAKPNPQPVNPNLAFTDIQGNWAETIIQNTKGFGIANQSKEFKPFQAITRGEFAVGLVNGLKLQKGSKHLSFPDVNGGDWYAGQVQIAASLGIINGRDDGKFDPNANIQREEAMAMIHRTLKLQGKGQTIQLSEVSNLLNQFKDGGSVSPWARENVAFSIKNKLIQGRPEGIVPKDTIRRAEAVQIILTTQEAK
ncbi:S-layer homology domain-containing protein [Peptoniphilus sp. KCTC 25270]|uniref:S-layer homology domain-containing protein n=1 Tax=Peptoniphilus sp. KCTC 25270 TaxID=2897414 RepID=UPI001E483328|nr:S-layer homology domain-containing protein [Peptoniphilus sp. KCTC 25270]MCD1146809.1 S-layer homology domain-containing protein [Peptoniphilus sp. KCTC 25270]